MGCFAFCAGKRMCVQEHIRMSNTYVFIHVVLGVNQDARVAPVVGPGELVARRSGRA